MSLAASNSTSTSKRTSLNTGEDPLSLLFNTPSKHHHDQEYTCHSKLQNTNSKSHPPNATNNSSHKPIDHSLNATIATPNKNLALLLQHDEKQQQAEQQKQQSQTQGVTEVVAASTAPDSKNNEIDRTSSFIRPTSLHTSASTDSIPRPSSLPVPSTPRSTRHTNADQHTSSRRTPSQPSRTSSPHLTKYVSHDLANLTHDQYTEQQNAARVKQLLGHRRSKTALKLEKESNGIMGGAANRIIPDDDHSTMNDPNDNANIIAERMTPVTSPVKGGRNKFSMDGRHTHPHTRTSTSSPRGQNALPSAVNPAKKIIPSPHQSTNQDIHTAKAAASAHTQVQGHATATPQPSPRSLQQLNQFIASQPYVLQPLPCRRHAKVQASKELQSALADDWIGQSHGHLHGEKALMKIDDVYYIQPLSTSYAYITNSSASNQQYERAIPGQFFVSTYRVYFQPDAMYEHDVTFTRQFPWPQCHSHLTSNLHVPLAAIERVEIVERQKSHQPRLAQQATVPTTTRNADTASATPHQQHGAHHQSHYSFSHFPTAQHPAQQQLQATPIALVPTAHVATAFTIHLQQILEVHARDGRVYKFGFFKPDTCKKVFDGLSLYAFPSNEQHLFALNYSLADLSAPITPELNGWLLYDPVREYKRLGLPNENYSLSGINADYSMSITYPRILCIPSSKYMTDVELLEVAEFRSRGRLPALVWKSPYSSPTLWRCSQPKVGVNNSRCTADEKLLSIVGELNELNHTVIIFDARPKMNARANMLAGKGYENIDNYPNCKLVFLNIGNIHVMRESYQRLIRVCRADVHDIQFLQGVLSSGWLQHISELLKGCFQMVLAMDRDRHSVVSHCSDGWDRTTQFVTLTELCLDPYYRTVEGFIVLIEKEWCSFGHQFHRRVGHMSRDAANDDRSPIFVQWLDCVYQLTVQFPHHFEFNSLFLVTIYDHMNSCRFGTFLGNSEAERSKLDVRNKSVSLGTYLLASPAAASRAFLNPLYMPSGNGDAESSVNVEPEKNDAETRRHNNSTINGVEQSQSLNQSVVSSKGKAGGAGSSSTSASTATSPRNYQPRSHPSDHQRGRVLYPTWSMKKVELWSDCYLRYLNEHVDHGVQLNEGYNDCTTTVFTDLHTSSMLNYMEHDMDNNEESSSLTYTNYKYDNSTSNVATNTSPIHSQLLIPPGIGARERSVSVTFRVSNDGSVDTAVDEYLTPKEADGYGEGDGEGNTESS